MNVSMGIHRVEDDTKAQVRTSQSGQVRPMQPKRFAAGVLASAAGVSLILSVAVGMFHIRKFGGELSLPLVAFIVLLGVMFLGGGFGVMATSCAGFDEQEFDRLSGAGQLCAEEEAVLRTEPPTMEASVRTEASEEETVPRTQHDEQSGMSEGGGLPLSSGEQHG